MGLIERLTFLDQFVFWGILLLTGLSVLYGQKLKNNLAEKERYSTLELLLMGRRLTLPLFVATLVATWYGGIIGVTALTFEKGIYNFLTQGVFWYGTYLLFAFFLVHKIRQFDSLSLPELVGKMFGAKTEKLAALLNFFNLLPIAYIISLGVFLQSLFGGELWIYSLLGITVMTLYSLWGGFRAVVFSDIVQFFVMIIAVVIVALLSLFYFGLDYLSLSLPASHFDFKGGHSISEIMIWGFIALSTLVDPNFYQRCLAADSEKTAKKGILISTGIWVLFDICTTVGALYARAAIPHSPPEHAYIDYALFICPPGIRGLVLAGILATILSTLDAYLFNAATCLSYDLFNKKNQFKPIHHHIALVAVGIFSFFMSLSFEGNVVAVWKTLGSFSAACLLFPMMIQFMRPQLISEKTFLVSVSSAILVMFASILVPSIFNGIDMFYLGLITVSIFLSVFLILRKIKLF